MQVVLEAAANRSHLGGLEVDLTGPLVEKPGCSIGVVVAQKTVPILTDGIAFGSGEEKETFDGYDIGAVATFPGVESPGQEVGDDLAGVLMDGVPDEEAGESAGFTQSFIVVAESRAPLEYPDLSTETEGSDVLEFHTHVDPVEEIERTGGGGLAGTTVEEGYDSVSG